MTINRSDFEGRYGFRLTHVCIEDGDSARFVQAEGADATYLGSDAPMVYLWLSPRDVAGRSFDVLYVGKAGSGVSKRLGEHERGFVQSSSGKKNLINIQALFKERRQLQVYARKAEIGTIVGEKVNLYSVEEEAFQEKYAPVWNRAVAAAGGRRERAPASA